MPAEIEQRPPPWKIWAVLAALAFIIIFDLQVKGYDYAEVLGNWYFGRSGPTKVIAGE